MRKVKREVQEGKKYSLRRMKSLEGNAVEDDEAVRVKSEKGMDSKKVAGSKAIERGRQHLGRRRIWKTGRG